MALLEAGCWRPGGLRGTPMIQSRTWSSVPHRNQIVREEPIEVEIFASAWPEALSSEEKQGPAVAPRGPSVDPGAMGEIVFAQAWPEDPPEETTPAPGAMVQTSAQEIDVLWEEFDQEVSQILGASRCPHCHSFLRLELDRPTVTCGLCGSAFATFHASPFVGQA